jgi:hypothetical protein
VIATLIFPLPTVGAFCFRTKSINMAHLKKRIFFEESYDFIFLSFFLNNFMILFCIFAFFNSYSLKNGLNAKLFLQKCKVFFFR